MSGVLQLKKEKVYYEKIFYLKYFASCECHENEKY